MQLVIVAGGKGTRLQQRLQGLPKPMVGIGGKPLLEHQVLLAHRHGIQDIILLLGHGAEAIRSHFGDGASWGVRIKVLEEKVPLGTAGAVLAALPRLSDRFLVMYGDTMLNVDLDRFCRTHEDCRADASLFVHPNDHPHDSDLVEACQDGRILAFHPYPHDPSVAYPNLVNAALYVLEKSALQTYADGAAVMDFGKHLFPRMLRDERHLHAYRSPEYIKDAGTPERLDRVIEDFNSGKIGRGSFLTPAAAVFLDRDGTLNREVNRVKRPEELDLINGVPQAIRKLNRSSFRTVVITNQPVIARGDCTEGELEQIHNKLETLLGREGAYLDAIYYCPHHPHAGYPGERRDLKIDCSCRKPAIGLIQRAVSDLNINLSQSWLVGDSTTDVRTARNAGVRSVLVGTGHAGEDRVYADQPDYRFPDLEGAVNHILNSRN